MCGISALFRYNELNKYDLQKLKAMNAEMHYRGPDDNGFWYDINCGLAQTRLSIIDIDNGKQPLFNENNTLVLVCNGEIYNYIELKNDLLKHGHCFNSGSDSETIIHLYEEYGEKCVTFLRGQYSFCLWDSKKKQLFAARDRIGEKTLYYAQIPGGVVFSTELKAILKQYIPSPQINLRELAAPIRYTCPLSNSDTYIDQIKRVEPGQYLLVNDDGIRKYHYWKRNIETTFSGSMEEAKKETIRLMRESVDISLRSDVPVAIMLSGGIDSGTIACLAKETGQEVHTITAGYKGQHDCDERDMAKRLARERGFNYHEIELDESDFIDCFDEFTLHIDEPITDSAALAQWALYKKAKRLGFKVLLGGMGGDELFYGYPYWNNLAKSLQIHRQHQALFPWNSTKKKTEYVKFLFKQWKYVLYAGYPLQISDRSICWWLHSDFQTFSESATFEYDGRKYYFSDVDLFFSFGNGKEGKELDLVYDFSFSNIMTMAYLYLSDREGMGNSVEIRSPLLDYKLVEFVSSIPLYIKYKEGHPKYFMKKVVKDILPDYIIDGPKKGFTPPEAFVKDVVKNYRYCFFNAKHKFYNSVLADRLLSILINDGK